MRLSAQPAADHNGRERQSSRSIQQQLSVLSLRSAAQFERKARRLILDAQTERSGLSVDCLRSVHPATVILRIGNTDRHSIRELFDAPVILGAVPAPRPLSWKIFRLCGMNEYLC